MFLFTFTEYVYGNSIAPQLSPYVLLSCIVKNYNTNERLCKWINTKLVNSTISNYGAGPTSANYVDKEVLFQKEKKVYQGQQKTAKDVKHVWPFQFDFRTDVKNPAALPSTGKFFNGSSVEYKLLAFSGHIGQDETHLRRMMNPDDQLFMKNGPINSGALMTFAAKHMGVGAEQELPFVMVRPTEMLDQKLAGPFKSELEIPDKFLPTDKNDPFHSHDRLRNESNLHFTVQLEIPQTLIEGIPFPLYLSVTSKRQAWIEKPPQVQLTALKIDLHSFTVARTSNRSEADISLLPIFNQKHLGIILGPQPVDVGLLLGLTMSMKGVVPTFETRLLERKYKVPTELTLELGGKSFNVKLMEWDYIKIVSRLAATGILTTNMPKHRKAKHGKGREGEAGFEQSRLWNPNKIRLQHSYIGRLNQPDNEPLNPQAVMEAALKLSRVLTASSIQHVFIGGSVVKLLPSYSEGGTKDTTHTQRPDDREILQALFNQHFSAIPGLDVLGVHVQFFDIPRGWKVNLEFPRTYRID